MIKKEKVNVILVNDKEGEEIVKHVAIIQFLTPLSFKNPKKIKNKKNIFSMHLTIHMLLL